MLILLASPLIVLAAAMLPACNAQFATTKARARMRDLSSAFREADHEEVTARVFKIFPPHTRVFSAFLPERSGKNNVGGGMHGASERVKKNACLNDILFPFRLAVCPSRAPSYVHPRSLFTPQPGQN